MHLSYVAAVSTLFLAASAIFLLLRDDPLPSIERRDDALLPHYSAPSLPTAVASGIGESGGTPIYIQTAAVTQNLLPIAREAEHEPSLFTYGNALGILLREFAQMHPDTTAVLERHATNRNDERAKTALKMLGDEYVALSKKIARIPAPPESAQNAAIADAYRHLGETTIAIAQSADDTAFMEAIYAYNARVDTLAGKMELLIALFAVHDIRFSGADAGVIFMGM